MARVNILREGYSRQARDAVKACGTITLITSSKNIVVDTGNVGDTQFLTRELSRYNLSPEDIDFVVNTHGHQDHFGNNSLFAHATVIGYGIVSKGDSFTFFEKEFTIDNEVKIITTPGHSLNDVTVIVNTDKGIVAVAGDIFENEHDRDGKEARQWSKDWNEQLKSRKKILETADYVIPGHGKMFKVKDYL